MDLFVYMDLNSDQKSRVRRTASPRKVHFCVPGTTFDAAADVFLKSGIVLGNPPPDWFARHHTLQWVQLDSAGFGEYVDSDPSGDDARERPVISNLPGFFAETVAETCLAGILALKRGIDHCVRLKERRHWRGSAIRPELGTLTGSRVVLFAFGSINRRLADLLEPFNCRVSPFGQDWIPDDLDRALAVADVVVCNAPHTPRTAGVFDRDRLGRLPRTAIFVNAGRGTLLDEAELARRLREGRLAGAVIDVTAVEPLPTTHPFWDCPNLILTQHSAGGTADETDRKLEFFETNLARYDRGVPVNGIINSSRGY
ncbi:MAG: D-2-hydroxyacid dehydrogenase [Paracoccaceae bacterium]|nr:D-2-hydroxyacid dehydrogenase [Paracoccaceae bacterium]MDE2913144.1 D-2-hydroxyacid dehydrogenase [Paracoccaceae bacterium]